MRQLTGPPLTLVLGDSERVLHRTTSLLLDVRKPVLFLATKVSTTLHGTLNDSLRQSQAGSRGLTRSKDHVASHAIALCVRLCQSLFKVY